MQLLLQQDKTRCGMKGMLAKYGWLDSAGNPLFGFHHVGMHDVDNITMVLLHLLEQQIFFDSSF